MRELPSPPTVSDPQLAAALGRLWQEVANLAADPVGYRIVEAQGGRTGFDFQRKDKATGRWTKVLNVDRNGAIETAFAPCTAIYRKTALSALPQGVATIVDYAVKDEDSDNAVTTGAAWKFTCPSGKAGLYHAQASVEIANNAFPVVGNGSGLLALYRNGVLAGSGTASDWAGLATGAPGATSAWSASGIIRLAAGDTLDLRANVAYNGNQTYTGTVLNRVAIARIQG